MHSAANILIALLVVVLILSRQLRKRDVREERGYRMTLILGVIGIIEVNQFQGRETVSATAWAILIASLVAGAAFGAVRGMTVHVWREDGVLYRQGNWLTLVLWIAGLGLHIGADAWIAHVAPDAKGLSSSSILLYLAVTLGAQQFYVLERGHHGVPTHA